MLSARASSGYRGTVRVHGDAPELRGSSNMGHM